MRTQHASFLVCIPRRVAAGCVHQSPSPFLCARSAPASQMVEKRETERRQLDEKKRKAELEFLRHQGKHLDLFLKQMGSAK